MFPLRVLPDEPYESSLPLLRVLPDEPYESPPLLEDWGVLVWVRVDRPAAGSGSRMGRFGVEEAYAVALERSG